MNFALILLILSLVTGIAWIADKLVFAPQRKAAGIGAKPEKIYLSQRDYDALVERINNPNPEQIESLRKLMNRRAPWDE